MRAAPPWHVMHDADDVWCDAHADGMGMEREPSSDVLEFDRGQPWLVGARRCGTHHVHRGIFI